MAILWQPSGQHIKQTNLTAFQDHVANQYDIDAASYEKLHQWSIDTSEEFWGSVWDYCEVIATDRGDKIVEPGQHMIDTCFFPDARLNFAENLLRRRDESEAIIFRSESGFQSRTSWQQLYANVSRWSQAFSNNGIHPGDRIVACLPNIPESVIGALATATLGAIWSSCSPDFGEQGILDRFQQIAPKILITCDGYFYNGKCIDIRDKISAITRQLPSLETVIIVSHLAEIEDKSIDISSIPLAILLEDYILEFDEAEIIFRSFPFNHPLYIMFSSGTTGLPKCIVHGAGGTLLQHLKEHRLHCDIKPGDKVFFFTTCGWMMWNWLVSALASEATLMLYDGSPFYPQDNVLMDYATSEGISFFGTSAKYIQAMEKKFMAPIKTHDLSTLRTIASTGSPLLPEGFDYVYQNIKQDVCLSSISGGTDIISCFVLGNPNVPVRHGEIQCKGLGMAVEVWDEGGQSVIDKKGELVCARAFPSMPIGFWNDDNNERYTTAYFQRFLGIWAHGDFAEQTSNGGYIIYGRSDAVLNPGGVRIGTAEIYRQVESFDEVLESVAVGQEWEGDIRILLFVVLKPGFILDDKIIDQIKRQIKVGASPRHVPAQIYQVPDIPRTRSGKITEIAIREVIHGREIKNSEALVNPESLAFFKMCIYKKTKVIDINTRIKTTRLQLRATSPSDIDLVWSATRFEGFNNGMTWEPPERKEDLFPMIQKNIDAWLGGNAYIFTVELINSELPIGRVVIRKEISPTIWNIGYWIHPDYWNNGYATEAARAIINFGFSELNATNITTAHAISNSASKRVIEKLGFKFTRENPRGYIKSGEPVAEYEYVINNNKLYLL
jgi:acetoacetyl-CoA synthetase